MSAPKLDSPEVNARASARAAKAMIARVAASAFLLVALLAENPVQASASVADPVRAIFANHDCCGRLANSQITRIGELRSGSHQLTIYVLWFVDPESHHGMKHLAIVEGRRFVGSYIISSWLVPKVEGDRVRFMCKLEDDGAGCDASLGDDLVIENGILPPRLWADGQANELGDTI